MHPASQILTAFLCKGDFSLDAAGKLESKISQFHDNATIEDLLDILASYRPGGGEFLFGRERLEEEVRTAVGRLSE